MHCAHTAQTVITHIHFVHQLPLFRALCLRLFFFLLSLDSFSIWLPLLTVTSFLFLSSFAESKFIIFSFSAQKRNILSCQPWLWCFMIIHFAQKATHTHTLNVDLLWRIRKSKACAQVNGSCDQCHFLTVGIYHFLVGEQKSIKYRKHVASIIISVGTHKSVKKIFGIVTVSFQAH